MKKNTAIRFASILLAALLLTGCGSVEVTRTTKVTYAPTRVEDV